MHKIIIKIKNKEVLPKLFSMLNTFNKDEVQIESDIKLDKSMIIKKKKKVLTDDIEKNWKKIAYEASGDLYQDDDEILVEAYLEYKNDKNTF